MVVKRRDNMIGWLIAGREPDNHCWFCRAAVYSKKPTCSAWCLRRMIDYGYHKLSGRKVVW